MKTSKPLESAKKIAARLQHKLSTLCSRVEIVGSVRRGHGPIGDLDVVVISDYSPPFLLKAIGARVNQGGEQRADGTFDGMQVNLWLTTPESLGAALFAYTGPKGYVIGYRTKARKMGFLLNEKGLFEGERKVAGETEESIFQALGKKFKAPEMRGL